MAVRTRLQQPRAAGHLQQQSWGAPRPAFPRPMPTRVHGQTNLFAPDAPNKAVRTFLDSADLAEWRKWAPTGLLHGVTTNPSILERDRVPCTLEALTILFETAEALCLKEVQVQAWGTSAAELAECSLALVTRFKEVRQGYRSYPEITIKLPCTPAGLAAANKLKSNGHQSVTITGVYHQHQVLPCLAVGAEYMAPYLGRMADQASEAAALEAVVGMVDTVRAVESNMRVLVASIRSPQQMAYLAARGANTFTVSPAVMEALCNSSSTEAAVAEFEAAAKRMGAEPPLLD